MFVARSIDRVAGGVERIITLLMNAMAARHHDVDLLTWDLAGADAFYAMTSTINWHRLNMGDPEDRANKLLMLQRAHAIRALVEKRKPQVIVCFQEGPFIALRAYTFGLCVPLIAAERNAPDRFNYIKTGRYRGLIFQTFRLAARIAIQCESYRALYPDFLQSRIVCIPNPVLRASCRARPDRPDMRGRYRLLSVGRLGFQKNYGVLIDAFARLASKCPDWDLAIIGDGEQRGALEALVEAKGLKGRVILPGTTDRIEALYASSHLFCLPSRWEGFPNALAEALAHGLPAVGFAECAGTRDLIVHGRCGILADGNGDVGSLARSLERVMKDPALRRSMGDEAVLSVQAYQPETIFTKWEQMLSEVTSEASIQH
jgi:glycosyltransferase involved in cell wall biosynthesis